jgi:hypothetical protein
MRQGRLGALLDLKEHSFDIVTVAISKEMGQSDKSSDIEK